MAKTSKTNRRLGRGLSSLIGEPVRIAPPVDPTSASTSPASPAESTRPGLVMLELHKIEPNPHQPRKHFDNNALSLLSASIRRSGVIQPIVVRRKASPTRGANAPQYELVAGERRWRAAQLADLSVIPSVIVDIDDTEAAAWALIENLQREDLGPMERAWAFRKLCEDHSLRQADVADRVGLDRSSVANLIRLTELEQEIQALITSGGLTPGHGRALLGVPSGNARIRAATQAAERGWSVRKMEAFAKSKNQSDATSSISATTTLTPDRKEAARADLEQRIGEHLGTKVRIRTQRDGKRGQLSIDFYDLDHFDTLLAQLGFRSE